jgi:hypothetical protein
MVKSVELAQAVNAVIPMARSGRFGVRERASPRASGVVLILAGLAVAAYAMPWTGDVDPAAAAPITDNIGQTATDVRLTNHASPADRVTRGRPSDLAGAPAPVVVTIASRPSEPAALRPRTAAIPRDREALARELQKELRRVGCYEGELHGAWTSSARRAMKVFTDRVNASLPIDEPDAVLLVMVQSQPDRVCDRPCPAGQGFGEEGRCLPNAILAKAAAKKALRPAATHVPASHTAPAPNTGPPIATWSATVKPTAAAPSPSVVAGAPLAPAPIEGRMGLSGPRVEQAPTAGVDPPMVSKPPARARRAGDGRPTRAERRFAGSDRRGTFAKLVFRRLDFAN